MGDVLEFSTARSRLSREVLRALGFDKPLLWRCERRGKRAIQTRGLYTSAICVAWKGLEQLRIVWQREGRTRPALADWEWIKAVLDVAVVQSALAREGRAWEEATVSCVFDDGGAVECVVPAADAALWRERALRMMRARGLASASTDWVSRRLGPFVESLAS